MKKSLLLLLTAIRFSAFVQQDIVTVKIAKFDGDRPAAICYGFDDGLQNQSDVALPLLKKYGFKATFFIIPSIVDMAIGQKTVPKEALNGNISWAKLKQMSLDGFEISSHSWSHKKMTALSDTNLQHEILWADSLIYQKIGRKPETFAYPYNAFDARVHAAVYRDHLAARESQFAIGADFTAQKGNVWADTLLKHAEWGITMIHGITRGFDALKSPQQLEDHFRYMKTIESKIWISTFSDIVKYICERDSSKIEIDYQNNGLTCKLSNRLDPLVYNIPLTIIVQPGTLFHGVRATRSGNLLPIIVAGDKILVKAVPGPQPLRIHWKPGSK